MTISDELILALGRARIHARFDLPTRVLYSTDASIYQIEPLGVVFPKSLDELAGAIEIAVGFNTPVLARGSGSSLAGQAIGPALILDCSRYLTQILEINPEERTALVEPGVILTSLNKAVAPFHLQFGPDPASAERASMGGSIANNATGAHSILYGMASDHLLSADVVLADGSLATFEEISLDKAQKIAGERGKWKEDEDESTPRSPHAYPLESSIYQAVLHIREHSVEAIHAHWPHTWRRAAGYNLNYLLPWTPNSPPGWPNQYEPQNQEVYPYPPVSPGSINLAQLMAGSEGTLAVLRRARVRLVPVQDQTVLGVIAFSGIAEACEAVPAILEFRPSAIELIPGMMIHLARSVPAFARQLNFLDELSQDGQSPDLLVVEFAGDHLENLRDKVRKLGGIASQLRPPLLAESGEEQKQVWAVRKVGLGLLSSRPGEVKSTAFIEDLSVPVERLGEFVHELQRVFAEHGTQADFYAHASAGCLHIRPMVNLKSIQGVTALRSIATEAVRITLSLGGSISGEHGIGLSRSEWLEQMYGDEIMEAFRELKSAADPRGLLNPGKILNAPRMDENLRFGIQYKSLGWQTNLGFVNQGGLAGAIEMCNGAGVCRKLDGVMCPSFQATREEMHSTRGRANLLRALISNPPSAQELPQINQAVFEALDLCLACKGCKAECPSAVDMAKLRYEFLDHYYRSNRRKTRDYLFAFIGQFARLGHRFAFLINPALGWKALKIFGERWLGLSSRRQFPALSQQSLHQLVKASQPTSSRAGESVEVLLLSDPFTEYFFPEVGLAAVRVLQMLGYRIRLLPVIGAGRTMISKGFLSAARRRAFKLVETIERMDPEGKLPIIGLEPSEIYTLRDEYFDLIPDEPRITHLAERAWMIDEFLIRPNVDGQVRISQLANSSKVVGIRVNQDVDIQVYLHGHCYQKAQSPRRDGFPVGAAATKIMLEQVGYQVNMLDTGCCGMAGAFGYEAEHYDLSMRVGELSLFPTLRSALDSKANNAIIAAAGVSCQAQIEDGLGRPAFHPIQLVLGS